MAKVAEGDPLPPCILNCEHIAVVPTQVALQAADILTKLGVNQPQLEIHNWTAGHFGTALQFKSACDLHKLPLEWNHEQIIAFLDVIDYRHYAVAMIDSFWSNLKRIGKILGKSTTKGQRMYFEAVRDNGKAIKDDRLPVSRKLLVQLIDAADVVFTGFNRKLAKAMFISAWGFCMRLSEFTNQKSYHRGLQLNYNLKSSAIRIAHTGLSAAFESDKTSTKGGPIKHRTVAWSNLPQGAQQIMEDYNSAHPDGSWFFCKNDGRALTRNDILNLLEPCLLHSDWKFLRVTPHSFRQGRPSVEPMEGTPIDDLMHAGRWTKKSTAFDHYSRTDLAMLPPATILQALPKCRQVWTSARLRFTSLNLVQTPDHMSTHPHHQLVKKSFPIHFQAIKHLLPTNHPASLCRIRDSQERIARRNRVYLRAQASDRLQKEMEFKRRSVVAKAIRNIKTKDVNKIREEV